MLRVFFVMAFIAMVTICTQTGCKKKSSTPPQPSLSPLERAEAELPTEYIAEFALEAGPDSNLEECSVPSVVRIINPEEPFSSPFYHVEIIESVPGFCSDFEGISSLSLIVRDSRDGQWVDATNDPRLFVEIGEPHYDVYDGVPYVGTYPQIGEIPFWLDLHVGDGSIRVYWEGTEVLIAAIRIQ